MHEKYFGILGTIQRVFSDGPHYVNLHDAARQIRQRWVEFQLFTRIEPKPIKLRNEKRERSS